MCGRFAFVPKYEQVRYEFGVEDEFDISARYNIAPGSQVLFLYATDTLEIKPLVLVWGLIPFWAKDKKSTRSFANARGESLFEKPAFRQSAQSKRGIMVMSGFYEWHVEADGSKQPYFIKQKDDRLMAVAAIWDVWHDEREVIRTCALITTEANALMQPIHNRMPVILSPDEQTIWMNNQEFNKTQLMDLIHPYKAKDLISYPVTRDMNNARFESLRAIQHISLRNE